jgi:lysophospholipid acyltransferase (LPLAT)-like uncharacterized protein
MKGGLGYRISLQVVPTLLAVITKLWFCTCRVNVHGLENRDMVMANGGSGIGSFWHYSFLYSFFHNRKEKVAAMVSASKDGEYISKYLEKFGVQTVRGSRNKGGIGALKGMIRAMRSGYSAAIVADGSQGPARVLQAGCIVLASRSGSPVIPMLWSCNRYICFHSWDRTAIPYPFSTIEFFYGKPLQVPSKISSEEIETYRLILEERLNKLYKDAWALQGKTDH